MKNGVLVGLACAAFAAAGAPEITELAVTQDATSRMVKISYSLNEDAIVTVQDVKANGVSVGPSNLISVVGHAALKVRAGTDREIWWNAGADLPGRILAGPVTVELKAWSPATPPDYLVAPLDETNVTNLRWYASEAHLPGGIGSDAYRTTRLAMRRIPAANVVWRMGWGVSGNWGEKQEETNAAPHYVKFTADYYMSVYEFTRGQYSTLKDEAPTAEWNRPLGATYSDLRGTNGWPEAGHAVTSASVLGKLRARTGLVLDLPTESQWEYACRAGSGKMYNYGTAEGSDNRGDNYFWCYGTTCYPAGETRKQQPVGHWPANYWGLYDMHGNAWEWCLDWVDGNTSTTWTSEDDNWYVTPAYNLTRITAAVGGTTVEKVLVDPVGAGKAAGFSLRSIRGGSAANGWNNALSSFRYGVGPSGNNGVRLVCPVPEP